MGLLSKEWSSGGNGPQGTGRLQHLSEPVFQNSKDQEYYQRKLTDEIGQRAVTMLTPLWAHWHG